MLSSIAFIPSLKGADLLKAKDALIDRLGLSTQIDSAILYGHINRNNGTAFNINSIAANRGVSILKSYGVTVFDKDNLKDLFEDDNAFAGLTVDENAELVKFLHEYFIANKAEQDSLLEILSSTNFLFDTKNVLKIPSELQFPSDFENEFSEDSIVLNETLYDCLGGQDSKICSWLKNLGVQEASDVSVIEQVICRSGYITRDNALDVGKFLFRVYKRQNFFEEISSYKLDKIKVLTKKGNLIEPKNAYLSSEYRPDVDLEPIYSEDIFISDEYMDNFDERNLYKVFWGKFGVSYSLELKRRVFDCEKCKGIDHLQKIIEKTKEAYWTAYDGRKFYFYPSYFSVTYAPLLNYDTEDHASSKHVWTAILRLPMKDNDDTIEGGSGFIGRTLMYKSYSSGQSYIEDMIRVQQKMPASDGTMQLSKNLFYNSEINRSLAGKYLPIIDVDCTIHESWVDTLKMKINLNISDLLEILILLSQDLVNAEENKERICKIYERIVELGINSDSVQNTIKSWAQNALIMSKEEKFVAPSKLSHITLDGFRGKNQAYIGTPNNKEEVLKLLSLMGVNIKTEDNVIPSFKDRELIQRFQLAYFPHYLLWQF